MYQLPEKFTGYDAVEVGVDVFQSLCFSLQGMGIVNIQNVNGYDYPKNYYSALAEDGEGKFHIYMNCFTSVFCFGHITDEKQVYLTKGELEFAIKELYPDAVVLSESILKQEITKESKVKLRSTELKQLNYWLPCSVGRVMFSWFFD